MKDFEREVNNLIERFYKKYYADKKELELYGIYGDEWDCGFSDFGYGPINIGDDYWSLEDIYVALNNNFKKEQVLDRYSYALDFHMMKKEGDKTGSINLWHWCKGKQIYTKEQQKEAQDKIELLYKELKNANNNK